MSIVDEVLLSAAEPWNPFNHAAREVDLKVLGVDPHVHPLTDQTAVN